MFTKIDRNSKIPLNKQIYDTIINNILTGRLKAGDKMPSTRILSDTLGVARNILVEVYEQLTSEGYLEVVRGKGTFISSIEIKPIMYRETKKRLINQLRRVILFHLNAGYLICEVFREMCGPVILKKVCLI